MKKAVIAKIISMLSRHGAKKIVISGTYTREQP